MSAYLAAPNETFDEHMARVFGQWEKVEHRLLPSIARLIGDEARAAEAAELALAFHDLGKLTKRWQERVEALKGKSEGVGVPHAFLGGCYLVLVAESVGREELFAAAFAVAIHHMDSALAVPSLEQPDVLAIDMGLVNDETGRIEWAFDDAGGLPDRLRMAKVGDVSVVDSFDPVKLTVFDLARLSEELRSWSLGAGILERHRRRLLVAAIHSIIKVCDIRAAADRAGEGEKPTGINKIVLEGGLLV